MTTPQDKKDRKPRNDRNNNNKKGKRNPLANDPVQKELDAIRNRTNKISELFTEKLSKIRELENTQYFRDIKAARETLKNDIYPRLEEIKSEETKIRSVIDAEKNTGKQLRDEMKEALPVRLEKNQPYAEYFKKNYDNVDREIERLQQQMLQVKSLTEERQIVGAVDKAKAQRKKIAEYETQINSMQGSNPSFGNRLGELREERNKIGKEIEKQKQIIAENQTHHDANKKKIAALRKELDGFKTERDDLNKQYEEKRKVLDEKFKVWKVEQDALRKQRDIEIKERKAKEALQRAEEEAERKKEEAMKPPKMAELETCNNLITYMKNLKYNKKKPSAKLNHSLESFSQFATFQMTPPKTGKEVADCVAALNNKKAEIEAYQAEVLAERAAEAAAKEAEEAEKAKESGEAAAQAEEAAAPAEEAAAPAEEPAAESAPAEESAEN